MRYEDIKIMEGKRVQIKTNDGFYITTTIPNNINSETLKLVDKYDKLIIVDCNEIVSIREVQE